MNRRKFLAGLIATPFVHAGDAAFLTSDIGPLRRVLVHTPGAEIRKGLGLSGGGLPFVSGGAVGDDAIEEHRGFVRLLKQSGAEVLEIENVLQGAIDRARSKNQFRAWLNATLPNLEGREDAITGAALIGASDELSYARDAEGNFRPLTDSLRSIVYTRDSAAMTPRGVILCNFSLENRARETALMRFAFEWSPQLDRYPVVFDAGKEQVHIEGGDVIVVDANTMLLGVGNRTDPEAARRLAMRLEMDVVAVQMPAGARTPIHSALLHLDTMFTFVNTRTALAVPFFLEAAYGGKDPLTVMLTALARMPKANVADLEKMTGALKDVGSVKLFRRGSGELDSSVAGMKLVDWIKRRGFEIAYVGGRPSEDPKHVAEGVMRELRFQAANVLAVRPGRVIAYAGNTRTLDTLRSAGTGVVIFPGGELMRTNGGPHCMTMPLERG